MTSTARAPGRERLWRGRPWAVGAAACLVLAGLSLLVPAAPAYDPLMWLHWGREIASLELSTAEGPAFKPLPVAVTTLLSVTGAAAPELWLTVARAGALAAVALACVTAARLGRAAGAAPRWAAVGGAAAAVGVALTERFVLHAAVGDAEPLLVALVLGALLAARERRHGLALALGIAAALLRSEVWPFLAVYGVWAWHATPALRPALLAGAALVPVAWFLPEWLASGQLLRSTDRALVPNPGAPALAARPALETLERAAGLLFVPTAITAALAARGAAAIPALAGLAWLALVALMSEAGFSGEERYALPGAAVLAVSGGAGVAILATRRRLAVPVLAVLLIPFAALGVARTVALGDGLAHRAALHEDLPRAIARAGGRAAVLRCGQPAVGRYRGPLLAYHLGVSKSAVRADGAPGGVSFRSRLRAGQPLSPPRDPAARPVAAVGRWRVEGRCAPAPSREGSARASWTGP